MVLITNDLHCSSVLVDASTLHVRTIAFHQILSVNSKQEADGSILRRTLRHQFRCERFHKKTPNSLYRTRGQSIKGEPDNDLLSHGETPHYHRRRDVSLLSSKWIQVVPPRYDCQTNWFVPKMLGTDVCNQRITTISSVNFSILEIFRIESLVRLYGQVARAISTG